jgi:hypothetical protein
MTLSGAILFPYKPNRIYVNKFFRDIELVLFIVNHNWKALDKISK